LLEEHAKKQPTKSAARKSNKFNEFEFAVIYNRAIILFNEAWTTSFVPLANKFRMDNE
jgi:hypothetical protein